MRAKQEAHWARRLLAPFGWIWVLLRNLHRQPISGQFGKRCHSSSVTPMWIKRLLLNSSQSEEILAVSGNRFHML